MGEMRWEGCNVYGFFLAVLQKRCLTFKDLYLWRQVTLANKSLKLCCTIDTRCESLLSCPCVCSTGRLQGGGIPPCSTGQWPKLHAGLRVAVCNTVWVSAHGHWLSSRDSKIFHENYIQEEQSKCATVTGNGRGEIARLFLFHLWAEGGVVHDTFLMLFWTLRKLGFSSLPLLFICFFLVAT